MQIISSKSSGRFYPTEFKACVEPFDNDGSSYEDVVSKRWVPIRRAYGNTKQDN